MATRRERVILDLEDNFSGPMARAAAAAALLNRELNNSNRNVDKTSKSTDRLGSSVSDLGSEARTASKDMDRLSERSVSSLGRSAEQQGKQIDRLSGRLALFAQAAAVLGPALVPLGAAAIPALSGMTLQLGLVAAAGGTAILAFHGVGDALKALDAAKLNPTAANLAKLSQEMDKLGPAGGEFVLFLDHLEGKLKGLRSVAQQGLLPGVQDGLDALLSRLPQVREIMFSLATTMGDLAKNAGESLAGPKFTAFFDYIQTTARPVLSELGQSLGNVFKGFADMLVGFDPLSRSFSSGMLAMSESFAKWAAGLSATTGFQDFVSYIQTNGPRALDAIGAIGNALVQLVSAAAPIGAVVLPVITSLANAFSAMADSSVGPALIATAAAVSVLSRSMAMLGVTTKGMTGEGLMGTRFAAPFKALPAVLGEARASVTELATAEREAGLAHARYIGSLKASSTQLSLLGRPGKGAAASADELVAANNRQAAASKRAADAERAKAKAISEGRSAAMRGAAAAAGLVVATSGLADGMGMSNTASLALMGTLAGPWGAAVGGGVGLVMDLAAANNDLETASRAASRAMDSQVIDFGTQRTALDGAKQGFNDYQSSIDKASSFSWMAAFDPGIHVLTNLKGSLRGVSDIWTHTTDEQRKSVQNSLDDFRQLETGAKNLYGALTGKAFAGSDQDLSAFVTKMTPALQRAKVDVGDFLKSLSGEKLNPALMFKGLQAIQGYFASFDSATGKSKAVAAALAALGNQMASNTDQANALKSAMDSLFGVQMSQSAATDAWTKNLGDLKTAIAATNGAIQGTSKAALSNREAIRGSVQALEDKVNADAAAGVSGGKLVGSLIAGRDAIVRQAVAAGASRKSVAAYLRTLGMTPKNLTTIIMADGALSARQKVQALTKLYHLTPKQVKTLVSQAGAEPSAAKIRALAKLYHLTPKQVRTLISADDKASAKAAAAKKHLQEVKDRKVAIQVATNAASAAAAARAAMFSVNSRTVTLTVRTQHITTNQAITIPGITKPRAGGSAAGNMWRAYAAGDVANGHQAELDRAPKYRMWAEPETKGEAYIPLADDWRRPRAVAIWEQTGRILGQYAAGGFAAYANGGGKIGTAVSATRKPETIAHMFNLFAGMSIKAVDREFGQLAKRLHGLGPHLRGLEGAAKKVAHAYNEQEKQLKSLRSKANSLSSGTQSALTNDPFGNGLTGLGDVLNQDKFNAIHMAESLKRLKRKGISRGLEAALAASGDSATAMELAKLSRSQINKYDALYAQRNKAADWAGDVAARTTYGGQIKHLNRTLSHLDKRLAGIEKAAERGAANGTRRGMNDKSRSSARNRRVKR